MKHCYNIVTWCFKEAILHDRNNHAFAGSLAHVTVTVTIVHLSGVGLGLLYMYLGDDVTIM